MRILCVAEKPSIAKAISNALGGGNVSVRNSKNKYIKNYDLNYNFPTWGPCHVTVTAVLGHVTEIEFVAPFNEWKHPPASLFSAPIRTVVRDSNKAVADNIRAESRNAELLFIWTDCDREGEHIGNEVAVEAKKGNPSIRIKRAHFNNVDHQHLRLAAAAPRELDLRQVEAVNARQELDLRTGFAMTRFQTNIYKSKFKELRDSKSPVSYGSCQFPTLGFVVDRYLKVKNHIPEPFWFIDLEVKDKNSDQKVSFKWDRNKLFDHMTATVLYERALLAGKDKAKIISLTKKPTTQRKPLPLTTVKLQKLGATYLKVSSKTIMDVAESLYNKGFISYPRTETDRYDKSIDVKGLVSKQQGQQDWGDYAKKLMGGSYVAPRQGQHDDKAHPPIHPIRAAEKGAFDKAIDFKVYEFITKHFLASCSDDAKGEQTTVKLQYGDELFHASGVIVRELNYLEIYTYASWKSTFIPPFTNGEIVEVASCRLKESKTTPPSYLTEPELIALMDANGIGTDATMAEHIQKIKDREFVVVQKKAFVPTTLGIALVESYDSIGLDQSLSKPHLRKETEQFVNKIANGDIQRQQIMTRMIAQYEQMFRQANDKKDQLLEVAAKYLQVP